MTRPMCRLCGLARAVRPGRLCNKCFSKETGTVEPTPARDVALSKIRVDGGTHSRESIRDELVLEYADALRAGEVLPPGDAYDDGTDIWLAAGFHRRNAYEAAGLSKMPLRVHAGTRLDAVIHSASADATHGLRRSDGDKRAAVLMLLREFPDRSTEWLASTARVSWSTVDKVRKSPDVAAAIPRPEQVLARDGTLRPARTTRPRDSEADQPLAREDQAVVERPTDARGTPLPDCLVDVFGDGLLETARVRLQALLDGFRFGDITAAFRGGIAERLPYVRVGDFAAAIDAAEHHLELAMAAIEDGRPYAVCPACEGRGCGDCRRGGHVPRWRHEELASDKAA